MNNQLTRFDRLKLFLGLCQIALIVIALTIKFWSWDFDDSFIVYRYVEHLLQGQGWVYNIGEKYNASTSVLNTALITIVSLFTASPQVAAHLIGAVALFLIGASSLIIFKNHAPIWFSCLLASLITFLMGNNFTWGLESNLFYGALLLFTALDLYGVTSWLLLGILILIRPDALLLFGLCTVRAIYRGDDWIRGLLKVTLVLTPWVVFSVGTFDQIFPATLSQKVWQGTSGFWGEGPIFLKGLFNYIRGDAFGHMTGVYWAPVILVAPLMLLPQGLIYISKSSSRPLLMLAGFIFSVLAAYAILNVPNYHWYYTGFLLIVYVVAFFGIILAHGGWLRRLAILDIPILIITLALCSWGASKAKVDFFDVRTNVYKQLSNKIVSATGPEARVAAVEVGVFGYQTKRPIIDIVGLTTPYGQFITGETNEKFFDQLRPEVIVLHNPLMPHEQAVFADPRFVLNYQQRDLVAFPGYSQLIFFMRTSPRTISESWPLSETGSSGVVTVTEDKRNFSDGDPWIEFRLASQKEIVTPVFMLEYDLQIRNLAAPKTLFGRVYYAGAGEAFSEDRAVPVLITLGEKQHTLVNLALPGTGYHKLRAIERLRFDPLQDLRGLSVEYFKANQVRLGALSN